MQFSVRMELYGKCMTSIFPYMEIVWLVFLVIPGYHEKPKKKELQFLHFPLFEVPFMSKFSSADIN